MVAGISRVYQGDKTMNYTKPQVTALGEAACIIGFLGIKESFGLFDSIAPLLRLRINPAYDLDE
jgi:hypothetical protein